nr:AraC family transcriptional regulator [Propionivibrio soli]
MCALPDVLRDLGEDPKELLSRCGVDASIFDDPDTPISHATRSEVVAFCMAATGCEHFGLLVGRKMPLRGFGALGLLMRYSRDLRAALRSLVEYRRFQVHGSMIHFTESTQAAELEYEMYAKDRTTPDQIGDGVIGGLYSVLKELCGPKWEAKEVRLKRPRPTNVAPYQAAFSCSVVFSADRNAVVFDPGWLDTPFSRYDRDLVAYLEKSMGVFAGSTGGDFTRDVRGALRKAILAGEATAPALADTFGVHERTLHRRLTDEGTSFHELLDEQRFDLARVLLEDAKLPIAEVAKRLGYTAASSFCRAFRRWSGMTPETWRERRKMFDYRLLS